MEKEELIKEITQMIEDCSQGAWTICECSEAIGKIIDKKSYEKGWDDGFKAGMQEMLY